MNETPVIGRVNGSETKCVHCSITAIGLLTNHLSEKDEVEEKYLQNDLRSPDNIFVIK